MTVEAVAVVDVPAMRHGAAVAFPITGCAPSRSVRVCGVEWRRRRTSYRVPPRPPPPFIWRSVMGPTSHWAWRPRPWRGQGPLCRWARQMGDLSNMATMVASPTPQSPATQPVGYLNAGHRWLGFSSAVSSFLGFFNFRFKYRTPV